MKVFGICKFFVENLKIFLKYMVKFVVVEEDFIFFLSWKVVEKMEFIIVNYERFESVNGVMILLDIFRCYLDIFNGDVGILFGFVWLILKFDVVLIFCFLKWLLIELKDFVK